MGVAGRQARRGLGRGLDALLPGVGRKASEEAAVNRAAPETARAEAQAGGAGLRLAPMALLDPNPDQPRQRFDEAQLEELAASIRAHGVLQPLLAREIDGRYRIVAGERRWRAAQLAGLEAVPVLVEEISDRDQLEIALIENLQREDLNPMEEARAYQQLVTRHGLSQEEVSTRVGKARATVANALRLLRLPPEMQRDIEGGRISAGHARALLSVSNFPAKQQRLYKAILADDLSVRGAEQLARRLLNPTPPAPKPEPQSDPQLRALEDKLTEALGAPARIKPTSPTSGRVEIVYQSLDDLDRLLALLDVEAEA